MHTLARQPCRTLNALASVVEVPSEPRYRLYALPELPLRRIGRIKHIFASASPRVSWMPCRRVAFGPLKLYPRREDEPWCQDVALGTAALWGRDSRALLWDRDADDSTVAASGTHHL